MSLDDWNILFISICIILVFTAYSPMILSYLPEKTEPFFVLALIGKDGIIEDYYPDDDPSIKVGEVIHWIQHLHNHMGGIRYVAIRVKLSNSTMLQPNSTDCVPCSAPVVYETRRVLSDDEIWEGRFEWSLLEVERERNSILIKRMLINGHPYQTNVRAVRGQSILLVFELWVFDETSNDFLFRWINNNEPYCVWNQIWFNVI